MMAVNCLPGSLPLLVACHWPPRKTSPQAWLERRLWLMSDVPKGVSRQTFGELTHEVETLLATFCCRQPWDRFT